MTTDMVCCQPHTPLEEVCGVQASQSSSTSGPDAKSQEPAERLVWVRLAKGKKFVCKQGRVFGD